MTQSRRIAGHMESMTDAGYEAPKYGESESLNIPDAFDPARHRKTTSQHGDEFY